MEDFIEVLFVLIAIGAIVVSSAMKASKRNKDAVARHKAAAAAAQKAPAAAPTATHPYAPAGMPTASASSSSVPAAPAQVLVPTVHTHLKPDCPAHDAPGSLGASSPEGKDPCHEDQLIHARSYAEPVQEEPAMTFNWSGENMVKAFVMQEVLTRPCQRRARQI